jgi:hypothetical protein
MRTRAWIACMAVVAAAFGVGAGNASAATINFYLPVNGAVLNDCTGEEVVINGTMHVKATDNTSPAAIKYQLEANLTGVTGTALVTGARYVMNNQNSDMGHAEFGAFGNVQQTIETSTILTRQGETGTFLVGDDFRLHAIAHLTISKGVPRAEKIELRADCR